MLTFDSPLIPFKCIPRIFIVNEFRLFCIGNARVIYRKNTVVPGALSPELKRQGCEGDHPPLISAEVEEALGLYIRFHIRLYGAVQCSRGKFAFFFFNHS
jgi:hypothetical protein